MTSPCPFCAYVATPDLAGLIAFEDDDAMVVPCTQQKPSNHGHALVVPRVHVPNLYELPEALAAPMMRTVSAAARAVKRAFVADGVSIRQNNEPAGGQDVFHLHFHIIPRFLGDGFEQARYETVDEPTRIQQAAALGRVWTA